MDEDALRALLAALGYEVRSRDAGWSECLLTKGDEAWLGRGSGPAEALRAAVRAACPSSLALSLLERALGAPASEPAPAPVPAQPPEEVVSLRAPARKPGPPPLVRRDQLPPTPEVPRAIEDLALLQDRVRELRDELGLCTRERQRLAILGWVCEARAHTDAFPEHPRIREEVSAVSRLLTELNKSFWSGSVTALQLGMTPRELQRQLLGGCATTWGRAAELAERELASAEFQDERRGHDAYGWADASMRAPSAPEGSAALAALVREVEGCGGPLERSAEPRDPARRPDGVRFLEWVRRLRALRRPDVDPEVWARLAGRLRWWSGRRDPDLAAGARTLEPGFVPADSWAAELGSAHPGEPVPPRSTELLPEVVGALRSELASRRIALVSSRRDPAELAALGEALAGPPPAWCLAEPGRLDDVVARIGAGEFDVVLGALGFSGAVVDHSLARAARARGVRYVRVNRGRPGACLRALARSFGKLA